jgi:hypothetical protein
MDRYDEMLSWLKWDRIEPILRWTVIGVIVSAILLFSGDYLSLRFRIPGNREQFGTVQVDSYLSIPKKGNKVEYVYQDPHNETCVHSLFPHFDCLPCWYLNRKAERQKQINM